MRLSAFEWSGSRARFAEARRPFRARTRREALGHALRGLWDVWRDEPNVRLQAAAAAVTVAAGVWLHLSFVEWLWVSFAIGLVFFAEIMNTAIEQTVDLVVGPVHDPLARQVKDIAAGCVLVAAAIAAVIGALTFGPRLLSL